MALTLQTGTQLAWRYLRPVLSACTAQGVKRETGITTGRPAGAIITNAATHIISKFVIANKEPACNPTGDIIIRSRALFKFLNDTDDFRGHIFWVQNKVCVARVNDPFRHTVFFGR
jgi:hypothetical protein